MARNAIDDIVHKIQALYPAVEVRQLSVVHSGVDDDGLWFFRCNGIEVQLESSTGNYPFLVESDEHSDRRQVTSCDDAISTLKQWLHLN